MENWHDFFVAEVGACAALVGLLFVALSINVTQILKFSWLAARGAQVLVVLTGALLEASLLLIPAHLTKLLAFASIAISASTWVSSLALDVAFIRGLAEKRVKMSRVTIGSYLISAQITTLPAIIGGALLLSGDLGYYWIAGGLLLTLVFALFNAWILLIEVLR